MSGLVNGAVLVGVEALRVEVEVDLLRRLPAVVIVGLPSPSVREAAERVRSAILASGLEFPRNRVVISLAPADLKKRGTGFDLPMALGILVACRAVRAEAASSWLFAGELTLGGELRAVRGALAIAHAARDAGFSGVVVPKENGPEASLVGGVDVRMAGSLREVVDFLNGDGELTRAQVGSGGLGVEQLDMADVVGQQNARCALEIAAAGGHNLMLEGPPGCGKTMLAARLPGLLPRLTREEALECTRVHSAAGLIQPSSYLWQRPFRAPHHTVSTAGMVGNAELLPGEASLAHHGVLFLDEFPEFRRDVREALRAPLEDRQIVLSRAGGRVVFPANFALVAAANPCPCGYAGEPKIRCMCSPPVRRRYRQQLAGPLLDRIDLRVELSRVSSDELFGPAKSEGSEAIRERVVRARELQYARNGGRTNSALGADEVARVAQASPSALARLVRDADRVGESARVAKRVLRVARTVADLAGAPTVEAEHVERALALRMPDSVQVDR